MTTKKKPMTKQAPVFVEESGNTKPISTRPVNKMLIIGNGMRVNVNTISIIHADSVLVGNNLKEVTSLVIIGAQRPVISNLVFNIFIEKYDEFILNDALTLQV